MPDLSPALWDRFSRNKQLGLAEKRQGKPAVEARPTRLEFILTDWCNLRCIMCPPSRHAGDAVLPLDRVFPQVDAALPYLERLGWQGGEFFHMKPVRDYFETLRAHPQVRNVITTNGLLLDEGWIRLLTDLDAWIQFSIDSPLKEPYEHIRRGGDFSRLVRNLDLIVRIEDEKGKRLGRALHVAVMRSNLGHLEEFIPFIEKYRFQDVSFQPVVDFRKEGRSHAVGKGADEYVFDGQFTDYARLNRLRDRLRDACGRLNVRFDWHLPAPAQARGDVDRPRAEIVAPAESMDLGCTHPWEGMWVCADRRGDIVPTCGSQFALGNIHRDSLADAWNGPRMQEYRRKRFDFVRRFRNGVEVGDPAPAPGELLDLRRTA